MLRQQVLLGSTDVGMVTRHIQHDVPTVHDLGTFSFTFSDLWQAVLDRVDIFSRRRVVRSRGEVRELDIAVRHIC
jgi:hypothetical protein